MSSRLEKRQRMDDESAAANNLSSQPPQPPNSTQPAAAADIDFSTYHHVHHSSHHSPSHSPLSPPQPPPLPVALWGLDPLFFSACKLLIGPLLSLAAFPSLAGSSTLHGRPVVRVEVVGVVVGRLVRDGFTVLHVDDSSGVLRCKLWTAASSERRQLAAEAVLGVCVRCVGRLHEWQGVRELNVEWLRQEADGAAEMLHWLECMRLYDECYRHPSGVMQRQQRDAVT